MILQSGIPAIILSIIILYMFFSFRFRFRLCLLGIQESALIRGFSLGGNR